MIRILLTHAIAFLALATISGQERLLLIQGAPGLDEYEETFDHAANRWLELAKKARIPATHIKPDTDEPPMRDRIQNWITDEATLSASEIWIAYIGHGTSNDSGAKLNLAGPDIASDELAQWLSKYEGQLVFIHGGSASAPFLTDLSGPNRILITATRSSAELNYARFGEFFSIAISDPQSDLDLDGAVSLLEAFVAASNAVETFYAEAGRLTSEHALIDDNGDGLGYEASAFDGLRPTSAEQDGGLARRTVLYSPDDNPQLAPEEIRERNRLESLLEALHSRKDDLSEEEYFEQLEAVLDQLADLYRTPADS